VVEQNDIPERREWQKIMRTALIALTFALSLAAQKPEDEIRYEHIEVLSGEHSGAVTSKWRGRIVTHEVIGDLYVVEGDIILSHVDPELRGEAVTHGKGNHNDAVAINYPNSRWPNGVLPYYIDPNVGETTRARIVAAVQHWNTVMAGAVKVVPRTTEKDYVWIQKPAWSGVCASSVGRIGYGAQLIQLSTGCSTGSIIHEIGHAFGLFHEQGREDRNRYVQILYENVQAGMEYNFTQQISNADDIGLYDYGSIMHYPKYAWSKNGLPTIKTIPTAVFIGQRSGLSLKDQAAIRYMYGK
jgi:hypothetical protein